jgi:hypothetical protein
MSKKSKNITVKTIDNTRKHLAILIGLSILTKALICILTITVFRSFIDTFDLSFHLEHAMYLAKGQIPYVNFNFEYPVLLLIPYIIALIPTVLFQSGNAFFITFITFMVLCDIGTIICIYFIGLKIWDNERAAMAAGVLYATAFSTAYFVISRYDAFPTFLLMLAVTFILYGKDVKGYISSIFGFFAKIFPVIALPFFILYNAKKTSIKQEIISAATICIPVIAVLILPFLILNPTNTIHTYLIATGASLGIYASSATYTIYSLSLHLIDVSILSGIMTIGMVISFIALLYIAYKQPTQEPTKLLKLILCALFASYFFTKFHSPQYIVWLTPFFALLAIGDIKKMVAFYAIQGLAYIEFPLIFGSIYVNTAYTYTAVGSTGWVVAVAFFTIEYATIGIYTIMLVNPKELVKN